MGRMQLGTSIDNTLRLAGRATVAASGCSPTSSRRPPERGYAYGDVDLWAEDGTLLATGSQTAIIKPPPVAWGLRGRPSSSTP